MKAMQNKYFNNISMSKSKINSKKRVKQSGGGGGLPRQVYSAAKLKARVMKLCAEFASKLSAPFKNFFNLLVTISKYESMLTKFILLTGYFINSLGLLMVLFLIILFLMGLILKFAELANNTGLVNTISNAIGDMTTFIPPDVLYVFIAVLKFLLALLMITIFAVGGHNILEILKTSPFISALIYIVASHLYVFYGIMGILFTIGLFLGLYNVTCVKNLGVQTYSGNVGGFITFSLAISTFILVILGFIYKLAGSFFPKSSPLSKEKLTTRKKCVVLCALVGFLYFFILLCNNISRVTGDATSKFILMLRGVGCSAVDDDCDTDNSKKCSFEEKMGSTSNNEFLKVMKGFLTTFFMIFVMVLVVLQGPLDGTFKLHQNIFALSYKLNARIKPFLDEFLVNTDNIKPSPAPKNVGVESVNVGVESVYHDWRGDSK